MSKTPIKIKYKGKDYIMQININEKKERIEKTIFNKIKGKPKYWYLENGTKFNKFNDLKSGNLLNLSDTELKLEKKEDDAIINIIIDKSSIVDDAQKQLINTSKLKGVKYAIGMPDIHPGPGCPIGASFITKDIIYPHFIGGDIGCGMLFCQFDSQIKEKRLKRGAKHIEFKTEEKERTKFIEQENIFGNLFIRSFNEKVFPDDLYVDFKSQLGTIGGGNHFAEIQEFVEIYEPTDFADLGLTKEEPCLMVHSGSRTLGKKIQDWWKEYLEKNQGLEKKVHQKIYLEHHDEACLWAKKIGFLLQNKSYRITELKKELNA